MKRGATNTALVIGSVLLTLLALEIGFRLLTFVQAHNNDEPFAFWWVDQPVYQFDAATGYGYRPDLTVRLTYTAADNTGLFANTFHTNNHGHISGEDDSLAKPPGTYRIALIGDSFTASVFNPTPWGDILQDNLNADAAFRRAVGAQRVDVVNFGLEAVGVAQFEAIYRQRVRDYAPDLVIVSFISEDLRRRFLWRGTDEAAGVPLHLTCYALPVTPDNPYCAYDRLILNQADVAAGVGLDAMRRAVYDADIARRPWTGFYPELLGAVAGYRFGWPPRITGEHPAMRLIPDDDAALLQSRAALDAIRADAPDTRLLHIPTHIELWDGQLEPIGARFIGENPDLNIIAMRDWLPQTRDQGEIAAWFNLPHDGHFSEDGAYLFAGAVQQVLTR